MGRKIAMRSVIDSVFEVEVSAVTTVGERPAIVPRISGRGWIFSIAQLGVAPDDPYPLGFTLADTWGPDVA